MSIRHVAFAQIAVSLVLILVLAGTSLFRVKGNTSPSEPRGLWRLTDEPLRRGTYVVLKMPLKQIAALNGDTVRTTPEGSYINGKLWPLSGIPAGVRYHFPYGHMFCMRAKSGCLVTIRLAGTPAISAPFPRHSLPRQQNPY